MDEVYGGARDGGVNGGGRNGGGAASLAEHAAGKGVER
jgi:hypothetical protein